MKILHTVEFYSPSVGGAQEVVKQLSEHLVALGHDVTVATTKLSGREKKAIGGVKIVEFDVSGNEARGYTGKDIKKYQQFLINGKFDVMMNYAAQQWSTDLAFEVIDQIRARKILVPCGFSGLYDPAYRDYFQKMPEVMKKYDKTVYLSNNYRDINFAKKHRISNRLVIPNGADEREFLNVEHFDKSDFLARYNIPSINNLILTVGTHTGKKGHHESIMSFIRTPIKHSSLIIIGNHLSNDGCYRECLKTAKLYNLLCKLLNNGNSIHVLSVAREDVIKFYIICDVFLFLSNIECSPLVLFECAASGLPFVTADVGNSREILSWTKSGTMIKPSKNSDGYTQVDYKEVAKATASMLKNSDLRMKYSKDGKKVWKKKFTWQRIAEQYANLYKGTQ